MPDSRLSCCMPLDSGGPCGDAAREILLALPGEGKISANMAQWSVYLLCGATGHDARQLERLIRRADDGVTVMVFRAFPQHLAEGTYPVSPPS